MILLDDIVQELTLPQMATLPDGAILFQVLDGQWIGVLIDIDHPGREVAGMRQGPAKEAVRRHSVTLRSQ